MASYKAQIIPDKPRGKADEVLDEAASMDEQAPIPKQPFYPVLTLVLYFGIKPWDTAKSLYEAVNIPDEFKPFIPDMQLNLIEVAWLADEVIDKFESDFKIVAWFFKQYRIHGNAYLDMQDPKLLRRIEHVLETMRMVSAFTGDPDYEAFGLQQSHNKEITMLAALKEYRNDLKQEGRKEGRKEERKDITSVFAKLLAQGRNDDVMRAIQDPEYLNVIMAEFGYDDEDKAEKAPKPN